MRGVVGESVRRQAAWIVWLAEGKSPRDFLTPQYHPSPILRLLKESDFFYAQPINFAIVISSNKIQFKSQTRSDM